MNYRDEVMLLLSTIYIYIYICRYTSVLCFFFFYFFFVVPFAASTLKMDEGMLRCFSISLSLSLSGRKNAIVMTDICIVIFGNCEFEWHFFFCLWAKILRIVRTIYVFLIWLIKKSTLYLCSSLSCFLSRIECFRISRREKSILKSFR